MSFVLRSHRTLVRVVAAVLLGGLLLACSGWAANDTLTITDPAALQRLQSLTAASEEMVFGGDFDRGWLTWERCGGSIELVQASSVGGGRPDPAVLLKADAGETCWIQQALPFCRGGRTYLATFEVASVGLGFAGDWQFVVRGADGERIRHVWGGARLAWERRGVLFSVASDQPVDIVFLTAGQVLVDDISVRPLAPERVSAAPLNTDGPSVAAHWELLGPEIALAVAHGAREIEEAAQQLTSRAAADVARFRTARADFASPEWLRIPSRDQAKLRAYVRQRLDARYAALRPYLARWHPGLPERRLRVLFLSYLVHFTTQYAPGRPGQTIKEQLGAAKGDCEVIARRFAALSRLWLDPSCQTTTVAAWAIGHALAAGDGYVADPTHNIVWFLDATTLNRMPDPVARYLLYRAAVPGAARQLLPPALEPNHKALAGYGGREDAYRFDYTSYLGALASFDHFYLEADFAGRGVLGDWAVSGGPTRAEPALVNLLTAEAGARVSASSGFCSPPNDPGVLLEPAGGPGSRYAAASDADMPQWIEFELGAPAEVEAAAIAWWSTEDRGLDFSLLGRRDSREPWTAMAEVTDNTSAQWHVWFRPRVVSELRLVVSRAAGQGRTLISRLMLFGKPSPGLENAALAAGGLTIRGSSPFFASPHGPEAMFDNDLDSYAAAQDDGLPDEVVFSLERPREIEAVSVTWYDGSNFAADWALEFEQDGKWATALRVEGGSEAHGFYLLDRPVVGQTFRVTVTECVGQQRLLARRLALLARRGAVLPPAAQRP